MARQGLLVNLDALLDTQLGAVSLLHPQAPDILIEKGYHNRTTNELWTLTEYFSEKDFKKLWENRDQRVLAKSAMTNLIFFIQRCIVQVVKGAKETHSDPVIYVDINTHPYQLADDEKEAIMSILGCYLGTMVKMKCVDIPASVLTPGYIKNNWEGIFYTDFEGWFAQHHKELVTQPIPRVEFFAPEIACGDLAVIENLEKETEGELPSPFRALEFLLVEYLALHFIPIREFSLVTIAHPGVSP
ncbi:hypothetical protein [Endozoicomonas sp. ONNA1]|uniref:hypothetical protein n=1 Tax=Endozoicomonas sp. ONNA1 TaxID=2828740 RepID=UPI00214855E1|nr:hypothetical protein [Endozoicomonas sp. ONNA1]